ncbi:MAG: DNA repair protein RecO [Melioribacteraceae bacterium]|nr:DNA repair protein RecO [Melioribacteraceae bacterium]
MTEIIKTDAVVLKKINHGESSRIVSLYSRERGKISVIAKGIRSPKSKLNTRLEIFNHVECVIYTKDSRDIQVVTEASTLKSFNFLLEDLDKYKFASAVLELYIGLLHENEKNERLFRGLVKILSLINESDRYPGAIFASFMIFFIEEAGYRIELGKCSGCGKNLSRGDAAVYSYTEGFFCTDCGRDHLISFNFNEELFNLLFCLSSKKNDIEFSKKDIDYVITFLEKHLSYHIEEFKGLNSLKIFR